MNLNDYVSLRVNSALIWIQIILSVVISSSFIWVKEIIPTINNFYICLISVYVLSIMFLINLGCLLLKEYFNMTLNGIVINHKIQSLINNTILQGIYMLLQLISMISVVSLILKICKLFGLMYFLVLLMLILFFVSNTLFNNFIYKRNRYILNNYKG